MLNWLRHALRDRLIRAVEEVVARYHAEAAARAEEQHREQLETLHAEVDRAVRAVTDATTDALHAFEVRTRRDLFAAGEREAVTSSAAFVSAEMSEARTFPHPETTLEYALSLAPPTGMALEFGVYSGTTLKTIAAARSDGGVYGFDSFEGLPTAWRAGFPAGTFDVDELPDVPGAELIVGWFDDTLPGFMAAHPGPVAFLHADADLYSSTVTILDHVGPRLRSGSVIVFNEYFNYPGWEQHEHRAWQEYVARSGVRFRYDAYTMNNEQVVAVITETPDAER